MAAYSSPTRSTQSTLPRSVLRAGGSMSEPPKLMCACRANAAANTSYNDHNPRRRFLSCACKNDPNKDGGCQDILHHYVDQMVQYCNNASTQAFAEALTILRYDLEQKNKQILNAHQDDAHHSIFC